MIVFLDTSSLVKLYQQESGSEAIQNLVSAAEVSAIYLSELAKLEFLSALWKKVRLKEITDEIAKAVFENFQNDIDKFNWIKLDSEIIKSASEQLMKYGNTGLRTLDSIQFASALTLKSRTCIFHTSDDLLKSLFEKEKLRTS